MKLKKVIAGALSVLGMASLAGCASSEEPIVTPTPTSTVTNQSTVQNEITLSFLNKGKARIDLVGMGGVTIKANGTTVTSGSIVDTANFSLTAEGTPNNDFYVYYASTKSTGAQSHYNGGVEKEHIVDYFSEIFSGYISGTEERIYVCITTTKGGWTKNLDKVMDERFEAYQNMN